MDSYNDDMKTNGEDSLQFTILAFLQIFVGVLVTVFGGIIILGNLTYGVMGAFGEVLPPETLGTYALQSVILLVLGLLLFRAALAIMEMDSFAFSSSLYLNIFTLLISLTAGIIGLFFATLSFITILLLFTPSVKLYWYDAFKEDMVPRIKETRYSLHLVRKSPLVVLGILLILGMISLAIIAPVVAPYGPEERIWADAKDPPGSPSGGKNKTREIYDVRNANPVPREIGGVEWQDPPPILIAEFTIYENETNPDLGPWLEYEIDFDELGDDNVSFYFVVYGLNLTTHQSMDESARAAHLYYETTRFGPRDVSEELFLYNATHTYVYVLWFNCDHKYTNWEIDIKFTIFYHESFPDHIWGTDEIGGDVFSRILWGAQIDIRLSLTIVLVAVSVGTFIGAAAGYYGGKIDEIVMRVTDVFFAFPGLVLAMAIVMALGARSLDNISIALMVTWWPTYARLVRGQVLLEREKLYVEAARSVGASNMRILISHIIPNTIQPLIVQATMDTGGVLLTAAGLSFIGFGPPAGVAEWGLMIAKGQMFLTSYPWMTVFPGLAILLTALGFNLAGDGIRDIMDPKLRRR